ncbi:MAG: DUF1501 domain-containing protein [Gemmataceae bacterium]|nr:DUF1501 domain-containing protein [Gemmataceae bacterium]
MLRLLGSPRRCCDGLTRRETLQAGALAALGGLSLPQLLASESRADYKPGKAKNVILLYLLGGAATQDMYDLKPTGPSETRGEFKPISTSVPGVQICEHLPRMAKWMHKVAVVRSVNHKAGCHNCLPSYTGSGQMMPDQHPRDTDPPSMGSVVEYLRVKEGRSGADVFPDYVYLPNWLGWGQVFRRAGPYGGFLGKRFDALTTECSPYKDKDQPETRAGYPNTVRGVPILPDSTLVSEVTLDRLDDRRSLLQQFDDGVRRVEAGTYDRTRDRAFGLLTSAKARSAFDLSNVDSRVIDRYGRSLFGQSTLIARRLIESGVRFVNVTWDLYWDRVKVDYDAWDTHTRNFPILKDNKLPGFDQTFSALMEDLDARGMLDDTMVVVTSEMGRTPKINASGGRDHWTYCYGSLFAGAGIKGGSVYGASDAQAAYVKDMPVSPADICCTVYDALGIDPHMTVPDKTGRPVPIDQGGRAITNILA